MTTNQSLSGIQRHAGPHLGLLAILYTVLFNAGLYPVTAFAGKPYWPGPWEPANIIVPYFQTHHPQVLACLFLQFGAIVCLGLFTAVAVSQMRFLGVRSTGPWIALLGGFLVVSDGFAGAFTTWTMIHPVVVQTPSVVLALYYLAYGFGGPGFSIPMGLLIAGISIPALLCKLLPKWICILGIVLAVTGELSWFHLICPPVLFLIPLTRFPGFIWLLAVAFTLPRTRTIARPAEAV